MQNKTFTCLVYGQDQEGLWWFRERFYDRTCVSAKLITYNVRGNLSSKNIRSKNNFAYVK